MCIVIITLLGVLKRDNVLKDATHIVFEHKHPYFSKGVGMLHTASNSKQNYIRGHAKFLELTRPGWSWTGSGYDSKNRSTQHASLSGVC